ncbi:MAG: hypothetical protein V2I57_09320 [Xanthomonadales bacterium]|jgi:hypothetical protein|nr:hypothetical protein [Xanthomonadales bacterium]
MRSTIISLLKCGLVLSVLALFAGPALADRVNITSGFSGIWDQSDHRSQGFILQISEDEDDGMIGVAYWFTYGPDLASAWYVAVGPVKGHEIDMTLYRADGVAFLDTQIEGNPVVEEIGTLIMRFRNCNQGVAVYDAPGDEIGSGEVRIKRLTSLYRQRCSGGISDNTPPDDRPVKLELDLEPLDEDSDAEGEAKFWENPARSELVVEIEDLADGTYALEVCEEAVGDIVVEDEEGTIRFRSPQIPNTGLLDFDPRNCRFDVLLGDTVVLTSGDDVLAPDRDDDDEDDGKDEDDPDKDDEIEVHLDSTGVIAGAAGNASYEVDDDRTHFKVRIRNVPPGNYPVDVDSVEVGVIVVEDKPGQGQGGQDGEIRFANPPRDKDEPLDFDPLGALIEVYSEAEEAVIVQGVFPDE